MLFDSSPKIGINSKITIRDITPTTVSIFGTAQMIEARKLGYKGFNLTDLKLQASKILQNQMYIIYHIGLTRYMMQHAVGANFVKRFHFEVTPESFTPTTKEISLYLSNPKFLWRFSAWNYNAMIHMFDPKHRSKSFSYGFKTFNEDESPVMSYVESRNTRIINNLKLNLKKLDVIKYEPYNFEKFETIQSYFTFKLNKYEQTEIYFADDYFLHGLDADTTYDEYIHLLITGDCRRYPSDLLLQQIDVKNDNLNKAKKKSFFKKVNKRLSKNSSTNSVLKYMSAKVEKSDPVIITELAELVAYNKRYVKIKNPLVVNPRWVNDCYTEILSPMSVFYWYVNGIFGNGHIIQEDNNSVIGLPWNVDFESKRLKWLMKQFVKVTSNFNWLYNASLKDSIDLSQQIKNLNKDLVHIINLYRSVALNVDIKQFPSPKKLKCFESYDNLTQKSYVSSSSVYSSIRSAGSKTLSLKRLFVHKNEDGPIRISEPINHFVKEQWPAFSTDVAADDFKVDERFSVVETSTDKYEDPGDSTKQLARSTTRRSTKGFCLQLCDIKEEVDEAFSVEFNTVYAQEHLPPSVHVIKGNFLSVYEFSNNNVVEYKSDIVNKMLLLKEFNENENRNLPIVPAGNVYKKQYKIPDSYVHPTIMNAMYKHLGFSHPSIELLGQGNADAWREIGYHELMSIVIELVYKKSPNCLNTKPLMHLLYNENGRFGVEPNTLNSFYEAIIYKLNNRFENLTAAMDSAMKRFNLTRNVKNFPNAPKLSAKFQLNKFEDTMNCLAEVVTYIKDYYLTHHSDMKFISNMLWAVHIILGSSSTSMKELIFVIARDIYLSELFERCKYFVQHTSWSYELFNFNKSNQELFEAYKLFELVNSDTSDSELKSMSSSNESLENNLSIISD